MDRGGSGRDNVADASMIGLERYEDLDGAGGRVSLLMDCWR